jgi:hypothetical protein
MVRISYTEVSTTCIAMDLVHVTRIVYSESSHGSSVEERV